MSEWVSHLPTGNGRHIPSDTPIEAKVRGLGLSRNRAGNFDNWRWRGTGPGTIEAYREIGEADLPRELQIRPAQ